MDLLIKGTELLGLSLTEHQIGLFQRYADELVIWNRRVNLTAITDYEEIQTKHFLDSISCLLAFPGVIRDGKPPYNIKLPSLVGLKVIDVGAGGGFPGLPLKIVCPELTLTLLDSVAKKTQFLSHMVESLGLAGVEVLTGRAEEFGRGPRHREQYDIVVSRAVAVLPVLAELCLPFAKVGGRLIAPKKGILEHEIQSATKAIAFLGGRLTDTIPVELPGLLDPRYLVVVDKVASTAPEYPRRVGIPSKKPLGQKP